MKRLAAVLVSFLGVVALASPAAADLDTGSANNVAVAVNTNDGASIFRLAFSIQYVTDGVVDQTNQAVALASCTECQTVALAFQVVLVAGDANVIVPQNQALAFNDQCVECVTYASATQLVLGVPGPVRLTGEGREDLAHLMQDLRDLQREAADMSVVELNAAVQAAKATFVDIFTTQLAPIAPSRADDHDSSTTLSSSTSTSPSSVPTTTSTTTRSTSTSTSAPDGSSTTTTTTTVNGSSTTTTTTTVAGGNTTTTTTGGTG